MELIADGVLILAALAAMTYCMVLSRRLRRLTELDGGLGAAITALSREVDHLSGALAEAKTATSDSATDLGAQCRAAHVAARRLETLVKSANKTVMSKSARPPTDRRTQHESAIHTLTDTAVDPVAAAKPPKLDADPEQKTAQAAVPEAQATSKIAEPEASQETARKPDTVVCSEEVPSKPTAASVSEPTQEGTAAIGTLDAKSLDQFIGAIIAKGDADENAALARRLVMALAIKQDAEPS